MLYADKYMDEEEEVMPLCDFPDYRVSSSGKVYLVADGVMPLINTYRSQQDGYLYCTLRNGEAVIEAPVHFLVAEHYLIRGREAAWLVHLDGNPLNNAMENLKWV